MSLNFQRSFFSDRILRCSSKREQIFKIYFNYIHFDESNFKIRKSSVHYRTPAAMTTKSHLVRVYSVAADSTKGKIKDSTPTYNVIHSGSIFTSAPHVLGHRFTWADVYILRPTRHVGYQIRRKVLLVFITFNIGAVAFDASQLHIGAIASDKKTNNRHSESIAL